MTNDTTALRTRQSPGLLSSSFRIFDLSLGEMLWSRRTIFMGLVVAAPVLISLFVRLLVGLGAPIFQDGRPGSNSPVHMTGPAISG